MEENLEKNNIGYDNMKKDWDSNVALLWTKMVAPIRPSISELYIYTKETHQLQKKLNRKLNILILGSTPEFRDWAFEENMNVTIVDASHDYHNKISRELRHKCIIEESRERVIIQRWEDMDFNAEFDIVIGDLTVGNVEPEKLEPFIKNVQKALRCGGLFLGKNFLVPNGYKIINPQKLIKEYYQTLSYYNPFSFLIFDLALYCIDKNNILDFKVLYNELTKLKKNDLITNETMNFFEGIGWDTEMNFKFHIPKLKDYEKLITKYLNIKNIEYGIDVYSQKFPLYIIEKG